jgi:hypothetical protein
MLIRPGMMRIDSRFTQGREVFRRLNPTRYVEPGTLASPFTITRAQTTGVQSTAPGSDGVTWNTFGADTARFFGTSQALGIELQRVNRIRNPRGEGGTTSPTNWSVFSAGGLTTSIAGRGTADGRDYVDLRVNGTTTSTFRVQVFDSTAASVTAGQPSVGSVWVSLVGGSLANITANYIVLRWSAGGTSFTQYTPTTTPTRVIVTGTAPTGATTAFLSYDFVFASGAAIDVTLRFSWPQLETNSAFASTPILPPVGAPAASTRGTDIVSATTADLGIGDNGACTVLWAGSFFATNTGGQQTILAIDDNVASPDRFEVRIGRTGEPEALIAIDGVVTQSVGLFDMGITVPINTITKVGMVLDGTGRISAVFNGYNNNIALSTSGGVTSGLSRFRLGGSGTTAVRPMIGQTNALYVSPTPLTDAELSAAVAAFTF